MMKLYILILSRNADNILLKMKLLKILLSCDFEDLIIQPVTRNTFIRKGGNEMNEFYETVANFLEELRCDSEERKYVIMPDDMKKSDTELKKMQKKLVQHLEKLPDTERIFLKEYFDVLDQAHFKEEQRAYYQGMMDGVQLLGGLGLIKKGSNMEKLIGKLK